jgi:glutamine cyclotransferase
MTTMICAMVAVGMASLFFTNNDSNRSITSTATSAAQSSRPTVQEATTTTTTLDATTASPPPPPPPPHILGAKIGQDCQVLKVIPHDETACTQGLLIHERNFLEGTGNHGESVVRIYDRQDGTIHKQVSMDAEHFGEGIASLATSTANAPTNNPKDKDSAASLTAAAATAAATTAARLVQLTWKKHIGFVYDVDTLDVVQEFRHATNATEGWGVTFDASRHELLVIDGSEWIHVWDATALKEKRRHADTFQTNHQQRPKIVKHLLMNWNSMPPPMLCWPMFGVKMSCFALIPRLVCDMSQLHPYQDRSSKADSFNGIAIVVESPNETWVTGKWGPHMCHVQLLANVKEISKRLCLGRKTFRKTMTIRWHSRMIHRSPMVTQSDTTCRSYPGRDNGAIKKIEKIANPFAQA